MKPSFIKQHGIITPGNGSNFNDGASSNLIMSEDKALELGLKPKAFIKHQVLLGTDPLDQKLLGPGYA